MPTSNPFLRRLEQSPSFSQPLVKTNLKDLLSSIAPFQETEVIDTEISDQNNDGPYDEAPHPEGICDLGKYSPFTQKGGTLTGRYFPP